MNKSRIRILSINLTLLLVVVAVAWWGWSALHPKAAEVSTTSTTVSMGDVSSTVSASGTVISPGDIGVSPIVNAQINKLNVKVGQRVSAGTLMATLENTALANSVSQAKATLKTTQINYQQSLDALATAKDSVEQQILLNSTNQVGYQATIDAAKKTYSDALANTDSSAITYQASVDSAKKALSAADIKLKNLLWTYQATNVLDIYGSPIKVPFCKYYMNQFNNEILINNAATVTSFNTNCTALIAADDALAAAQSAIDAALLAQKSNLAKDEQSLVSLRTAIASAETAKNNSFQKDLQTLAAAEKAVKSAQYSVDLFKAQQGIATDTPKDTDLGVAQAALAVAQKNYDATFVRAPVSGTVASIAAGVGQSAPTSSSSVVGAVTGFIVLTDVSSLQVSAGFSEADAAKLVVGQSATFSYAALTNVNSSGKLVAIDTLPTTTNGATSYKATFSIDGKVNGLKPGMTATATVKTGSVSNVLQVTSQAVSIRGRGATVNVLTTKDGKDVITPTPVVVGLQGDSSVQIISGVKEGTKVVLRSNTSSVGTNGFPSVGVPSGLGGAGLAVQSGGGGNGGGRGGRG